MGGVEGYVESRVLDLHVLIPKAMRRRKCDREFLASSWRQGFGRVAVANSGLRVWVKRFGTPHVRVFCGRLSSSCSIPKVMQVLLTLQYLLSSFAVLYKQRAAMSVVVAVAIDTSVLLTA